VTPLHLRSATQVLAMLTAGVTHVAMTVMNPIRRSAS
jgi:hypothetical protein